MEHQEFTRTCLKCQCIPEWNWNLEMLVFEERGKPEYPEESLSEQSREPTLNKLNPHMMPGPGIEPGPHWWEANALTTASSLLPKSKMTDDLLCFKFLRHSVDRKHSHSLHFQSETSILKRVDEA